MTMLPPKALEYLRKGADSETLVLLDHIDEQAGQIATLKAALICEREESVELFWHPGVDFGELPAKRTSEAKAQLAQEYPGIFKEETKCDPET